MKPYVLGQITPLMVGILLVPVLTHKEYIYSIIIKDGQQLNLVTMKLL